MLTILRPLRTWVALALLSILCLGAPASALQKGKAASKQARLSATADLQFALDTLESKCGHFFKRKGIDWKKVRKEMKRGLKSVENEADHHLLLVRLLAHLRDGHCRVKAGSGWPDGVPLPLPEVFQERSKRVGSGLMFCKIGKKLYVRNSWSTAAASGINAGMEVVSVDGLKALKWLAAQIESTSEFASFSTDQHARYGTWRWGFKRAPGARVKFELKAGKKSKRRTLTFDKAKTYIAGPAVVPDGVQWIKRSIAWGHTPGGNGYFHVRRIDKVVEELDAALSALGNVPGLVLDFRGNSGGGCDHDAFQARFVPLGQSMQRIAGGPVTGAGPAPYGGPIIVIVDGTVVSAGETTSGMFKEDGRAYMIGESPTAGMSSSKETIQLPSEKFALYISVRSNRISFNKGKGIEGIGVAPHELVEYVPAELTEGIDTMIRYADELIADYPQKEIRYDPKKYGWTIPSQGKIRRLSQSRD